MKPWHRDLTLIKRSRPVFDLDWRSSMESLCQMVRSSRVLVIGGAGSIGAEVTRILFEIGPAALHVVDANENGLVDLVRSIRSSAGYATPDFRTICFDMTDPRAEGIFSHEGGYDAVLNFAAVKHVRSEKDRFSLARMMQVNVELMHRLCMWAENTGASRLFSVSTDKAANPVNLMGASKRIMESIGFAFGGGRFRTARFANVAFSNGSLLNSFYDRMDLLQPLSAPADVRRFFITHEEAARLCLLQTFLGPADTIAVPAAPGEVELTSFTEVVTAVLASRGFEPLVCATEDEARSTPPTETHWPCFFFNSDTTGEKQYEEFLAQGESCDESPFREISIIRNSPIPDTRLLNAVLALDPVEASQQTMLEHVAAVVPGFSHHETGRNLDQRM